MIEFKTNKQMGGTTVLAIIDPGISNIDKPWLQFEWESNDEMFAALLVQRLRERQQFLIGKAHQDAYERGYKHGKGHRRKATFFSEHFCKKANHICY